MDSRNTVIYFVIAFLLILLIDSIWLGLIARNFYIDQMREMVTLDENGKLQLRYFPAFLVYVLLALGLSFYVLPGTAQSGSLAVWITGFVFGFIVYGVYDMTNLATLTHWKWLLAGVDMLWGGVLCGTVSLLTQILRSKF